MRWSGLRNFFVAVFAIVVLAGFSHSVGAASTKAPKENVVRISDDYGGDPDKYLALYKKMARRGTRVIVAGECSSACTLLLGIIPHDNVCVTESARFGFHSATEEDRPGVWVYSRDGTRELMATYPKLVRDWIRRNGGLPNAARTDRTIDLQGQELLDVTGYRQCSM